MPIHAERAHAGDSLHLWDRLHLVDGSPVSQPSMQPTNDVVRERLSTERAGTERGESRRTDKRRGDAVDVRSVDGHQERPVTGRRVDASTVIEHQDRESREGVGWTITQYTRSSSDHLYTDLAPLGSRLSSVCQAPGQRGERTDPEGRPARPERGGC